MAQATGLRFTRRTALGALGALGLAAGDGLLARQAHASRAASQPGRRKPKLYNEKYRPQFHFTAQKGWINDPNGMVYHAGWYHLFFQYDPVELSGNNGGNRFWGHAISRDMVHWRQLPVALAPDAMGAIWSGSAVVDWKNTSGLAGKAGPAVIAIYTAAGGTTPISNGKPFVQCIAWSHDGGMTLNKYQHNPVMGQIVYGNRDPKVFWHDATRRWIMPLFLNAERGFALLHSRDLKSWHKTQELQFPQSQECPNMFPLPDPEKAGKIHWIFSGANGQYLIGDFDGRKFTPRAGPFAMDTGNSFYASQVFSNIPRKDGRIIQITWMRGGTYPGMPFNQQLGFPCQLSLHATSGGLRIARYPVREIEHLWKKQRRLANVSVGSAHRMLKTISADTLDIELEIEPGNATQITLTLHGQSAVWVPKSGKLSCLGANGIGTQSNGRLRLRALLDRTSLEIFGADGLCAMSSCFLPKAGRSGCGLTADGSGARVASLAIRELKSAWSHIPPA